MNHFILHLSLVLISAENSLEKVCGKFCGKVFGKLVLACEDETLNTTETSLVDKKFAYEKNNYLIHTILLIIICFPYYYY